MHRAPVGFSKRARVGDPPAREDVVANDLGRLDAEPVERETGPVPTRSSSSRRTIQSPTAFVDFG